MNTGNQPFDTPKTCLRCSVRLWGDVGDYCDICAEILGKPVSDPQADKEMVETGSIQGFWDSPSQQVEGDGGESPVRPVVVTFKTDPFENPFPERPKEWKELYYSFLEKRWPHVKVSHTSRWYLAHRQACEYADHNYSTVEGGGDDDGYWSAKITIYLVPHGYQVDVEGSCGSTLTKSRDYGGNIEESAAITAILDFVHRLDMVPTSEPGIPLTNTPPASSGEAEIARLTEERDKLREALRNCYALAKRHIHQAEAESADSLAWPHIVRFCESAGIKSSLLREGQSLEPSVKEGV